MISSKIESDKFLNFQDKINAADMAKQEQLIQYAKLNDDAQLRKMQERNAQQQQQLNDLQKKTQQQASPLQGNNP
jgi:hypothetical protein